MDFQLVQGAAGVPEPAAGGLWHRTSPHAAITATGAAAFGILSPTPPVEMFVDGLARSAVAAQVGEVHPLTGRHHGRRPARGLAVVHAAQEHRHQQRRHLLVGDVSVGVCAMTQSIAASDSRPPSRLVLITVGASKFIGPLVSGEILRTEGVGQQDPEPSRPLGVVDEQVGPTVLQQHLAASAARHQQCAAAVNADQCAQPAATRRMQGAHHRALGAET